MKHSHGVGARLFTEQDQIVTLEGRYMVLCNILAAQSVNILTVYAF